MSQATPSPDSLGDGLGSCVLSWLALFPGGFLVSRQNTLIGEPRSSETLVDATGSDCD